MQQSSGLLCLTGLSIVACGSVSTHDSLINPTKERQLLALKTMKLESTAFAADGLIPFKYTCDGTDISPPLSWNEPPVGTQSFALILDDPDAPVGIFVHWVLYDIPIEIRQLPERVAPQSTLPNGGVQGKNDFGKLGYGGPCPPSGTHRYFFKLYALDRQLELEPGTTKNQLEVAMDGYILATAQLIGRYSRQR